MPTSPAPSTSSYQQEPTASTNPSSAVSGPPPAKRRGWRFWRRTTATPKGKWSRRRKITVIILVLLACLIVAASWFGFNIISNLDRVFHGNILSDTKALLSNTQLKGEAQGRVNFLLMGDTEGDSGYINGDGADQLTDSIMVVSINTQSHSGFMLSIPRDLWVNVPGNGHQKINASYEELGSSGTEQLVQTDLGIPIDYYALVNYAAFEDLVNAVGGISVDIQSPDPRGLYDPEPFPGAPAFFLTNGRHTLNGTQALNLARARGNAYGSYGFPQSDFNRTQHQRQLLLAIAQKAGSLGVLTNPVKISQMFSAIGKNVHTDMNLAGALRLAQITKAMNLSNIQSEGYSYGGTNPLLTGYTAPNGEEALVPTAGVDNFSQLQHFYQELTSNNAIVKENASVVVLNGSDIVGLAHTKATTLEGKGFNVTGTGDANTEYPDSVIVDQSTGKDPATKQALSQIFSTNTTITTNTASSGEAGEAKAYPSAQFVVVLGKNWDNSK